MTYYWIVAITFIIVQSFLTSCFSKYKRNKFLAEKANEVKEDNKYCAKNSHSSELKKNIRMYIEGIIRLKLFIVSYIPSHRIRKLILKYVYRMNIQAKTVIYYGFEIRDPWNIQIGNSIIGDKCILDGRMGITIGDNVNISTGAKIWTLQHAVNDPYFSTEGEGETVVINDRAWIGGDVTILPGCEIGEGCVIATGAVVTKDAEPYSVYGGIPARKINQRNKNLLYEMTGNHYHFL